jgi:hypothetical protein
MINNSVKYTQEIKYNIKPSQFSEHKTYWHGRGVKVIEDRYLNNGLLRIKLKTKFKL